MSSSSTRIAPTHRFLGTLSGDGRPGPIEERIGRRLVRLVDPQSDEGRGLMASERVEWTGPDGDCLGCLSARAAYDELMARLERMLETAHTPGEHQDLQEGLERLKDWSAKLVR